MILVDLDGASASRPGRPLFEDLSLTVATGDRLGVVGQNGAGKSTLLRVITGQAAPESGAVRRGRGVRVSWLDQRPELGSGRVRDVVARGLDGPVGPGGAHPEPAADPWEVDAVLDRIGLGAQLDADVANLSGGQAKRVALARALVAPSDLLVLDEPTNHLDIDGIDWLEDRLAAYRGGLVLVTHDRHLLDRVTTRILELDRGRGYVHDGGYASFLEAKIHPRGPGRRGRVDAAATWPARSWPGCGEVRRRAAASPRPASRRPPPWWRAGARPRPGWASPTCTWARPGWATRSSSCTTSASASIRPGPGC